MLRGLRLHLVSGGDVGHERHVHEQHVARRQLLLELARGLDEGKRFDVADGAADLGYDDIGARRLGDAAQPCLDGLGNMGDDLHGAAQVVAAALARDETLVDGSLGEVGIARQVLVDEALVVPEIKVALVAVLGHEHLAVLEGRQGTRVDVEVRIHLLHCHPVPARLEQVAERSGRDPLAEAGDYAAENKYIFYRHAKFPLCSGEGTPPCLVFQ